MAEELARSGVERAVISPGSRSTPLAVALWREPGIEVSVILDERSAGFFALGTALATGRPAAVLCTSGSAAANLHPAVVEADEAGVPLIVLTADRPPELRDIGAGQTIDQLKLYGDAVRWFCEVGTHEADDDGLLHFRAVACRAYATAIGDPRPGPVHLNVPWREPLAPSGPGRARSPRPIRSPSRAAGTHRSTPSPRSPRARDGGAARPARRADRVGSPRPDRRRPAARPWSRRAGRGARRRRRISDPGRADLAASPRAPRPLADRLDLRPRRARPPRRPRAGADRPGRRPADQQAAAPVARGDRGPRADRDRPRRRLARADAPRRHHRPRRPGRHRALPDRETLAPATWSERGGWLSRSPRAGSMPTQRCGRRSMAVWASSTS